MRREEIEQKHLEGLVSFVDKEAEKQLVEGLSALLPEAVFLTEEQTVRTQSGEYRWIIDPLDGTTNFLYNIPHYSISVALQQKDETVLGIVQHVPSGEQFYAWKNGGAYVDGLRLQVSDRQKLSECVVATGFYYDNRKRLEGWLNAIRFFIENTHNFRRFGSAALDLAWVAAGRFDAFYEYGLKPWDVAAGALLLMEAGGKVQDFKGGADYVYGEEILATNPFVQDAMLGAIRTAFNGN